MSVPNQTPINIYTGNGLATTFAYGFYLISAEDLLVLIDGVQTVAYTVDGIGSQTGGSIIFTVAPADGARIVIARQMSLERETDYQPNGDLRSATLNADLDRIWMALQDNSRDNVTSLKYPLDENVDGTLPNAATRSLMVLGFDELGNHTLLPLPASIGAGDLRDEIFVAGVDFTAGVSTSLTLSRSYDVESNILVHMDGAAQSPTTYSLSGGGNTLQFDAPIPVGVTQVWVKGGTVVSLFSPANASITDAKVAPDAGIRATKLAFQRAGLGSVLRTISDVLDDSVNVKDFGAIGDGLSHPLSDYYATLADAQVHYPMATSLTNQIDDVAIASAINYAKLVKSSVEFPYGIFLVRQVVVYTDTVLIGHGRNATVLKQVIGSNTDLIYGANSNANWGSASPADIVNGCTIKGMTLDGQWNSGAGNTAGSGIAVYGARPIFDDVFIKNVADYGIRTEYNPTSPIGADAFTMEGELRNIRIDVCGRHGFWFNGPNDTVMDSVIVVDAGQLNDNTYDAFHFDQYAVSRCYALHGWNRQAALRHRFALNLRPGAQCEFDDCQFEGAHSANVQIQSQRNIFSSSCRFFAAWNGVNIFMGGNATLNQIRGILDGAAAGRPAAVAGIIMGSVPGDFVADNLIDVLAIEQQAGVVLFNFSGGYNTIRARAFQSAGGTYSGVPHTTDDIEIRQHSATALDVDPKRYAAWVVFSVSGGGAVTINASYNVTSVVRAAAGQYTITFANSLKVFAMMDGSCDYGQIVGKKVTPVRPGGNTATTQDVHFRSDDGTFGDPNFASIGFVNGL